MPSHALRSRPGRAGLILAALAALSPSPDAPAADRDAKPAASAAPAPAPARWVVAHRDLAEGRGTCRYWQVDYTIRNDGPSAAVLRPDQVLARVEGTVSNSRVPGHARPRPSTISVGGPAGPSASCDVIPSADESRRCRERAVLQVWPADKGSEAPDPAPKAAVRLVSLAEPPSWAVAPGASLRVRLRLEHDHFLYGPYDALLGPRSLELTLGATRLKDTLPLDHEGRLPRAASPSWPFAGDPPADRLDHRLFVSAPDSLHLEAHVPGNQSYRFKECPVRYGTRMRLRYWYLIAPGTEGEGKARVVQYKDSPTAWKILADGDVDQCLPAIGRWVKVDRVFRTEPEATSLTLEFRLPGDVGEMWIDDVTLEPVEDDAGGP